MSTSTEKKPTTAVDQDTPLPIPNLVLPQLAFILNEPKAESRRDGVLDKLLAGIEKDGESPPLSSFLPFLPSLNSFALWVIDSEMAPYLSYLLESNKIPSTSESTQLLKDLEDKNQQYLKDLEAKLEDSKTNLGETEVSDALRDKASYLAKIGEKVKRFRDEADSTNSFVKLIHESESSR